MRAKSSSGGVTNFRTEGPNGGGGIKKVFRVFNEFGGGQTANCNSPCQKVRFAIFFCLGLSVSQSISHFCNLFSMSKINFRSAGDAVRSSFLTFAQILPLKIYVWNAFIML